MEEVGRVEEQGTLVLRVVQKGEMVEAGGGRRAEIVI